MKTTIEQKCYYHEKKFAEEQIIRILKEFTGKKMLQPSAEIISSLTKRSIARSANTS